MASMEELEGRVTALEVQMRNVRQDAAAARVLAGGADRDVSALAAKVDANTRLLEALRETQVEDHAAIVDLKGDVASLKGDVGGLKGDVGGLKGDVGGLKSDVGGLKSDVGGLKGDVGGLKGDVADVRRDVAELKVGFVNLARGQEMIVELLRRRNGREGDPPASAE
jgi:outer membrane murein-binding lipoprotein Lpp